MASHEDEVNTTNTPFPNPPTFWQSFTDENVAAYKQLRNEADTETTAKIPDYLENLQPPAPPADGEYNIFGEKRSLAAPQIELPRDVPLLQSIPGSDPSPQHLLNLSRSLMLSYLELLHIMAINPDSTNYGPKWDDLNHLFKNIHHGLNAYRPWQARDALIKLLQQTRDRARTDIVNVQDLKVKVEEVLGNVGQNCEHFAFVAEERQEQEPEATNGVNIHDHTGKSTRGVTNGTNSTNDLGRYQQRTWDLINEDTEE